MKIIEKIKTVPKRSLLYGCIIAGLAITTVVMTVIAASLALKQDIEDNTKDTNALDVFNRIDDVDTEAKQTEDLTGVNGLSYISRGDGTCYIAGMGSCTVSELVIPEVSPTGDTVTKINDGAFSGCASLLTVTIPHTVKSIGTGVFRGCDSLVSINVDSDNSVYCSVGGVLFSKDKTVLICYPMNRAGSSYLLSSDVKAISSYAFEGAINLNKLLYEGDIKKFQSIDILIGNDILDRLSITCNYVPAK